jgi:dolichol-phosphate mannosyltransferase
LKALVVVPTYNEAENIERLAGEVLGLGDFDLLIVDDGSPDGTGQMAETLKGQWDGRLDVLHRQGKQGLGTAYVAGFKVAIERNYDYVFEMDADFSHNPGDLPRLLAAAQSHQADIVLGSRYVAGGGTVNWSPMRKVISRGGSLYARLILGVPVNDLTGGFKCFRGEALAKLDLEHVQASGYSFQIEMTYRAWRQGLKVVEVPIVFVDRRAGVSKMSQRIVWEAMLLTWKLRLGLV